MEAVKDVAASVCGAFSCVYTGQPLDTIKVRMQVAPQNYPSMLRCFHLTIAQDGFTSLWRGAFPAFVGAIGENAMAFGVNGYLKRLQLEQYMHPLVTPYVNGFITGLFAALVLCPSDVIKCRTQMARIASETYATAAATNKTISTYEIARHVVRVEGVRGIFTGLPYQCARDGSFYLLFFGTYEILASQMQQHGVPEAAAYFVSGGLSGQLAWCLALPFDTMKSIVQTNDSSSRSSMMSMVRQRGVRGLYRGFSVVLLRAFPANAALFLGYETARDILQ